MDVKYLNSLGLAFRFICKSVVRNHKLGLNSVFSKWWIRIYGNSLFKTGKLYEIGRTEHVSCSFLVILNLLLKHSVCILKMNTPTILGKEEKSSRASSAIFSAMV